MSIISKWFEKGRNKDRKNTIFIQIYRKGSLQIETDFQVFTEQKDTVTIGYGNRNYICLEGAKIPKTSPLFVVNNGKAQILLDADFSGYVSDGEKLHVVKDLLFPKQQTEASLLSNPVVPFSLTEGAIGKLSYCGYEIVFKVIKESPLLDKGSLKGLEKTFFHRWSPAAPTYELLAPCVAIICGGILGASLLYWVYAGEEARVNGFESLPSEIATEIIHPDHFRYLPFVFEQEFDESNASFLAIYWVSELSRRWSAAESGLIYVSAIPILDNIYWLTSEKTYNSQDIKKDYEVYYEQQDTYREEENTIKTTPYLRPPLTLSNNLENLDDLNHLSYSLRYLGEKRIKQLSQTYFGLYENLKNEHILLKDFYKNLDALKSAIVAPPITGRLLGPQPDPAFKRDLAHYISAEMFARTAEESDFLKRMRTESEKVGRSILVSVVKEGLFVPSVLLAEGEANPSNLVENALYTSGTKAPPPKKVKKPTIDMIQVEFMIFNKREQIQSCYDIALSRNPGIQGTSIWQWAIDERGHPSDVVLKKSTFNDQGLAKCIKNRISLWSFPKAKNGTVTITYPFHFSVGRGLEKK